MRYNGPFLPQTGVFNPFAPAENQEQFDGSRASFYRDCPYLVSDLPLNVLGWISVGLIGVGSAFLVPEIKFGKGARRGVALMEEISE